MSNLLSLMMRRGRRPHHRPPAHIPNDAPATDAIFIVLRRMRAPLIFVVIIFGISVLGLTLIPGKDSHGHATHLTPFEAFYFTAYTASTIGFGEIVPFTTQQRMWVTVCIFMTVIGWAYAIGTLLSLLQSPSFQRAVATQRFRGRVKRIREPFLIVCGYGQAGRQVCRELDEVGRRFVVLDHGDGRLDRIFTEELKSDVPALNADASLPGVLGMAGLDNVHCEGVLALTDDDTDNLSIVMAATALRPHVRVIARCMDRKIEQHMCDFAASAVINPNDRFGGYLALAVRRPATYRLITWLMDPHEGTLPNSYTPPRKGTWVICADEGFAQEVSHDLCRAGLDVVTSGEDEKCPDLGGVTGFVAGTKSDTTNLALAQHAKNENSELFVTVRQTSKARKSIIEAMDVDSVFIPAELVAQESLARVITPTLWSFIEHALRQPEEFSKAVIDDFASRCGASGKEREIITLSREDSPALHRWMTRHELTLGEMLRDPDDRSTHLALVPLVLKRGEETLFAPPTETTLREGDQVLVAGTRAGLIALEQTQFSDAAIEYITTGESVPETWIWRHLTRKNRITNK